MTAVNVNMLAVEYFHPKTTPNMSVRLAVRMSLSIPGKTTQTIIRSVVPVVLHFIHAFIILAS